MLLILFFTGYNVVTLGDLATMSLTIFGCIQICELNYIFVCCIFILFTLPIYYRVCFGKLFDMVSEDIVGLYQLAYCCHQLVQMDLVRSCINC